MQEIILLVIIAVIVVFFFCIGLLLRKRSRWTQIAVTTAIAATVFLSIALVGSGIGVGGYDFYNYGEQSCQNSNPPCTAETEQERYFRANLPRLILWMTVPKPFRPLCQTISPEFCLLEKSYDMAPYNYIAGAFGAAIVIFFIGQGMRQKNKKDVQLDASLPA